MAQKLTLRYDKIGDILYVEKCPPYAEQESDELDDEIVARFNPKTGDVESFEILIFTKRIEKDETIELPLSASLRLAD